MTPADEISAQQAAALLNVSEPYLADLVERGEIPARTVGSALRLKASVVVAYRDVDQARRTHAVGALAAEAQALGLY